MSRWFRVDDGLVDDPKVQQLPDRLIVAILNLWCITSQCGGNLPPPAQVAFKLRTTTSKAIKLIDELRTAGLIEDDEEGSRPHNWRSRQFKSDVTDPTNAERQKRFKDRHKVTERTVTKSVTITPTRAEAETEQKKDAARAAPELPLVDEEADLYRRGKQVLGKEAGGLIRRLVAAKDGRIPLARAAVEQAATKQDAREYIGAIIRGRHPEAQTVDPRL